MPKGYDKLLPAYNEALELYRNQSWEKAIDAFKASNELEDMFPGRKTNPSQIYIPRCEHYKDNPPGDNWDGSWALTKKQTYMNLPFYTASDVEAAVSMPGAINAMKEAFGSISSGDAVVPPRINMPIEKFHAHHLSMPAYINGGKYLTVKLINVHPNNPAKGLQLINGVILVMEAETGKSVAQATGSISQ